MYKDHVIVCVIPARGAKEILVNAHEVVYTDITRIFVFLPMGL